MPVALVVLTVTSVRPSRLPEYLQGLQPASTSFFETVYQVGPERMEEIERKLGSEMHSGRWSEAGSIDYTDSWENYVSSPFMNILWTYEGEDLTIRVVRRNAFQALFRSVP